MSKATSFLEKRLLRGHYGLKRILPSIFGAWPDQRIVFLHIPKTAGSSINNYFRRRFGPGRSGRVAQVDDRNLNKDVWQEQLAAARRARFVFGHFGGAVLPEIAQDAFVFTFLRDPRERVLSAYSFFSSHQDANFRREGLSLEDFLKSEDPYLRNFLDNTQSRQLAGYFDMAAQEVHPDSVVDRAMTVLESMGLVGFVDRFDEDFERLLRVHGLDIPRRTPKENSSREQAEKSGFADKPLVLSDEAEILIGNLNRRDQELYDLARQRYGQRP